MDKIGENRVISIWT